MVDTIVFAVGRSGETVSDVHVKGLRQVLDALPGSMVRVIYVSSTGVYAQDSGEWVDEESVCDPAREGGRACLAGERLLFAHGRGRDAMVLRLAGLYGAGRVPRESEVAAGRSIAGSSDAYLNLIHVEDAALAIVTAAVSEAVAGRTYNVSDGRPLTRGEYVALVGSWLQVSPPEFEGGVGLGKRVRNDRLTNELGLRLRFPSPRTDIF